MVSGIIQVHLDTLPVITSQNLKIYDRRLAFFKNLQNIIGVILNIT